MDNRDTNSFLSWSQCLGCPLNCWHGHDFWVSPHIPFPWKCACLVNQSCATLCNPKDCSPPGSFVHKIFQARILEWITMSYSRGSSQPRDGTQVFRTGRHILYYQGPPGKPLNSISSEGSSSITLPNVGLLQAPSFKVLCVFPQKYPSPPTLLLFLCTETLPRR